MNPIQAGSISFLGYENVITEGGDNLDIQVARTNGSQGIVKVSYHLQSGTAIVGEDILEVSGELVWADGDSQVKLITITPLEDEQIEEEEQFTIVLESIDDSEISDGNTVVSIIDNDRANTAPVVSAGDDRNVNAGETVSLVASATDAEGDALTYQWAQVSGETVSLTESDNTSATFVAPNKTMTLIFKVTVSDFLGATSVAEVTINVTEVVVTTPPTPKPKEKSSSGGAFGWLLMSMLMFVRRKRN